MWIHESLQRVPVGLVDVKLKTNTIRLVIMLPDLPPIETYVQILETKPVLALDALLCCRTLTMPSVSQQTRHSFVRRKRWYPLCIHQHLEHGHFHRQTRPRN